jgi:hypothetical protein
MLDECHRREAGESVGGKQLKLPKLKPVPAGY